MLDVIANIVVGCCCSRIRLYIYNDVIIMYNKEQRNQIGLVAWSALALLLGILVIVPMVGREIYQSRKNKQKLELDDLTRYGIFICVFSLFHWCICDLSGMAWWTCL